MTLYTDGLITRPGRNPLDDVVTGQLEAAGAAFEQAWFENPTSALSRINELSRQEQGPVISPAYPAYGIEEQRAEPETPLLSAEQARERVTESGLKINIEDTGIRQGALDILLERKRAEHQRQVVLDGAPTSTVPIQLAASFAASAIDPVGLASAFIPVIRESRYASMLARAGSRAARFGVRARVGAVQGAVGAAILEPIVLYASEQDQADYDMADSLTNIAFGGILGGGLHSVGGVFSDMRRTKLAEAVSAQAEADLPTPIDAPEAPAARFDAVTGDEAPMARLRDQLTRAIEADRPRILEEAKGQAVDEMANTVAEELQNLAFGGTPNVRAIRAEVSGITARIDRLDDTFRERAKDFQRQGMSRKQAEKATREAIADERTSLTARAADLSETIDGNRAREIAKGDLAAFKRGEIPERYKERVEARAQEIAQGFQVRGTARAMAEAAPWPVRQNALRAAVAQMATGRPVDVELVFAMANPAKQRETVAALKKPPVRAADPDGELASSQMAALAESPDATDLASAEKMLADDLVIAQEMADQAGFDLQPYLKESAEQVADANTFSAAYRAAALCQLRA